MINPYDKQTMLSSRFSIVVASRFCTLCTPPIQHGQSRSAPRMISIVASIPARFHWVNTGEMFLRNVAYGAVFDLRSPLSRIVDQEKHPASNLKTYIGSLASVYAQKKRFPASVPCLHTAFDRHSPRASRHQETANGRLFDFVRGAFVIEDLPCPGIQPAKARAGTVS